MSVILIPSVETREAKLLVKNLAVKSELRANGREGKEQTVKHRTQKTRQVTIQIIGKEKKRQTMIQITEEIPYHTKNQFLFRMGKKR